MIIVATWYKQRTSSEYETTHKTKQPKKKNPPQKKKTHGRLDVIFLSPFTNKGEQHNSQANIKGHN